VEDDPNPHSEARLISEVTTIQPGTPFTVAVDFQLDPGWHNYWRNAGDSGLPTTIEWTLPEGFQAGEIQWPVPERIVAPPLVDYGYSDRVALLVDITPPPDLDPGGRLSLDAQVDWLICETLCLPAYADLTLTLDVSAETPRRDSQWEGVFQEARDRMPRAVEDWAVAAEVTDSGYRITVRQEGSAPVPDAVYFFAADGSVIDHAAPQVATRLDDGLELELESSAYATQPTPTLRGVLLAESGGSWDPGASVPGLLIEAAVAGAPPPPETSVVGAGGVEAAPGSPGVATPSQGREPDAQGEGTPMEGRRVTLAVALLFAFLGGMILNLMPCVFPILSLKVLGAAAQGGEDRSRIRNQGLVFGLGVVLSFLALGGLLLLLRAGGAQLGWGFQLQSPLFVAFMALLFFGIGLNLMGVFEVGASLTRLGAKPGGSGGYGESLASGVLATVIATPCTAPFMGAALGFALTRSMAETLLIFGFLGAGMALPYMALSVSPGLLERLPRPGPWMETLKQVLAFPMFATVVWLVWVFGQQTGMGGAGYLLTGLLLLSAAGWMVGRWPRADLKSGRVARAVSLVVLLGSALAVLRGSGLEPPAAGVEEGWLPFDQAEVDRTLAQGRPAFVDFTAAWCLTCQVNERVVLSTEIVREAFRSRNVALFKADWTRQDPDITAALARLDRNGVPVYALYRGTPGSQPHLLPAILTEQIVLDALDRHLSP